MCAEKMIDLKSKADEHEQNDHSSKADDFSGWLKREECLPESIRVAFLGTERGFGGLCISPVPAGQELVSFPASLLMDRSAALRSAIGPCLQSHPMWSDGEKHSSRALSSFPGTAEPDLWRSAGGYGASDSAPQPDAWAIILLLLHERARGDSSPWHPYIAMIPPVIDAAATCFTAEEADALLAGTALAAAAREAEEDLARLGAALRNLRARYPDVFPAASDAGPDPFGPDQLRWAHAAFWSRALQVQLQTQRRAR